MRYKSTVTRPINILHVFDEIYHFFIALLPVLYLIGIPGLNISLGTAILLICVPHSLLYIMKGMKYRNRISVIFFFVFYLYLISRADGSIARIILCIATFINLFGQIKGSIQSSKIRAIIEGYAMLNVILVVIQTISYYIFKYQIQYIPRALIYEEYRNSYVFRSFSGLYRPSALFLEPAHFSQFCIFALISSLFPLKGEVNFKKALAIGAGCILTTSGMGIALTFGVFAWYMVLNKQKFNKRIINILKWLPVLVAVTIFLSTMPFFQTAMMRIFSKVGGYNAIAGRTQNWDDAIGSMYGQILWFGYGGGKNYDLYLAGLADTIYKYGIIGIFLEFMCFLYLMFKKVDNYVWCSCVVFMIIFCVAHVTNFYVQVFYFGILIADVNILKRQARCENQCIRPFYRQLL